MRAGHRTRVMRWAAIVLLVGTLGSADVARALPDPKRVWIEGKPRHLVLPGGNEFDALTQSATGNNVPLWTGSFTYKANSFAFTMVGTDPGAGSATSTIPVVFVPLQIVFASAGLALSASDPVCGGTDSAVSLAMGSPLFVNQSFAPGGTDVGATQYIDAFQRANFWSEVSTVSTDYHVLFSPTVLPTQTINVPVRRGQLFIGPCAPIGAVNVSFFDLHIRRLITQLGIPPTTLPVFLTYNTFLTQLNQCCIVGYHSATTRSQTYVMAAYSDPGIFDAPIEDVHALSHELGEWVDDPFGTNRTPGWKAGQATHCQANLEVGDPVTGVAFTATVNGTTYHLEDLVFLPWFARQDPSSSVNGWYTFLNTYSGPAAVCP